MKAMISSTAIDLPEHRKCAMEACLREGIHPIGMEHLPARDATAIQVSLEMVDEADIYIGIYAWRYGWVPDGSDISITEMEFNRALERKRCGKLSDILVFVMHEDHPVRLGDVETDAVAQAKLKNFKQRAEAGRIRLTFNSPEELKGHIMHSLAESKRRLTSAIDPRPKTVDYPEIARLIFELGNCELRHHEDLDSALKKMSWGLRSLFHFSLEGMNWTQRPIAIDYARAATDFRRAGDLWRTRGDADRALKLYNIAQEMASKWEDCPEKECERGKLLSSLAEYYLRLGKTDAALEQGRQRALESIRIHENQQNAFELFQSYRILADLHLALGEPNAAEDCLKRADRYWGESRASCDDATQRLEGWLQRTWGDFYASKGEWFHAGEQYKSALKIFRDHKVPMGMAVVLKRLEIMCRKRGNDSAADKAHVKAVEIIKSVPGTELLHEQYEQIYYKLGRIGVASSVSLDHGTFDPLVALDYAAQNGFSPVQLYLDPQIIRDSGTRKNVLARAEKHRLPIMLHAPGLLKLPEAVDGAVVRAALDLLVREKLRRVVYHFDETQSVEESLAITESLCALGIVPCIENFHQLRGAENARRNYANYLDLLSRIRERSLLVIPVIDIPRTFHEALELTDEDAYLLTIDVLRSIGSMEFPILLHLIDAKSRSQARSDWCPLGQGTIPYARIFREVAGKVRFDDVVLEFEDRENPPPSREFLKSLALP
jgi:tetratricopeptide (TPR) repeat protein